MEEGGGSKEKLYPSITCTDGASGGTGASGVLLFFFFVNKTHPTFKSDILAIRTIRFLFVCVCVPKKSQERWGGGRGGKLVKKKKKTTKQCRQKSNDSLPKLISIL